MAVLEKVYIFLVLTHVGNEIVDKQFYFFLRERRLLCKLLLSIYSYY